MVEGGGARSEVVWGGVACIGVHVEGGGPYPQGVEILPWNWPRGGYVEVSGGDFKSPAHSLHHLPRLPPPSRPLTAEAVWTQGWRYLCCNPTEICGGSRGR